MRAIEAAPRIAALARRFMLFYRLHTAINDATYVMLGAAFVAGFVGGLRGVLGALAVQMLMYAAQDLLLFAAKRTVSEMQRIGEALE